MCKNMIRYFFGGVICLTILFSIQIAFADEELPLPEGKNVKEWYAIGIALISENRYEEAIKYYDKILEINPNDEKALLNKGSVLIELDRIEEAIKYYERIIEINPNNVKALASKGIALAHLQEYNDALVMIDRALLLDPDNEIVKGKKANFLSGAPTIPAHDSVYEIKFRITVRDSSGSLISVSESTNTRYLPYEITDEIFAKGFDSKDTMMIDGTLYERVKKFEGAASVDDRSGMFSITTTLDGWMIDVFQAFTPMIIIEKDDVATIEWTILKEIT